MVIAVKETDTPLIVGFAKQRIPVRNTSMDEILRGPGIKRRTTRIARAMLAALALLLVILGIQNHQNSLIDGPLWVLQQSSHLKGLVLNLGMMSLVDLFAFALVGILAVLSLARQQRFSAVARHPLFMALLTGIGLSVVVSTAASGPEFRWPNLLDLILPSAGALLGGWIGTQWLAGKLARQWLIVKLLLLICVSLVAIAALLRLAIDSQPLEFTPAELLSADRVRLTQLIRSKSPRVIPDGQTVVLALTERDINLLLTWGLSLGSPDRKAKIELANDMATIRVSMRLPMRGYAPKYLNVLIAGQAEVEEGNVDVHIRELRIGRLHIPRPFLWLLSSKLAAMMRTDPLAVPVLAEIRRTELSADYLSATYGRIEMPAGFRDDIFGSIGPENQVYDALSVQFQQIEALGQALPAGPQGLGPFLRAAFRLAHARSQQGDPVVENRAAIIALGISMGHDVIGEFVGRIPREKVPRVSPPLVRRIQLRGRTDWSRHFLVSAALAVVSVESLSQDVGILKEELDAGTPGGSGFSFADIAADRSGTEFGKLATQSERTARELQRLLLDNLDVGEFFPVASDLPENIPQLRLDIEYGGVGGTRYRQLLAEIDHRIADCSLYRAVARVATVE